MLVTHDPDTHPKAGYWIWGQKLKPMRVVKRGMVNGTPKFLVDGREQPIHHNMITGWCEDYINPMWDAASIQDAKELLDSPNASIESVQLYSLLLPPCHPYYSHNLMPAIKLVQEFSVPETEDIAKHCGYHLHEGLLFGIYKYQVFGGDFCYVYRQILQEYPNGLAA